MHVDEKGHTFLSNRIFFQVPIRYKVLSGCYGISLTYDGLENTSKNMGLKYYITLLETYAPYAINNILSINILILENIHPQTSIS